MKRARLKRISYRRLIETTLYRRRTKEFLIAHPYCQVWLAEHNVLEAEAIQSGGVVMVGNSRVSVPLSTQVHHKNKRRGTDLLDEQHWMAVSSPYHRRIECNKEWARMHSYLLDF
jgi:hypothetical protein